MENKKRTIPDQYLGTVNRILERGNYVAAYFGEMKLIYISTATDSLSGEDFMEFQVVYKEVYQYSFHFRFESNGSDKLDEMVLDGCIKIFTHAANKAIKSDQFKFKPKKRVDHD